MRDIKRRNLSFSDLSLPIEVNRSDTGSDPLKAFLLMSRNATEVSQKSEVSSEICTETKSKDEEYQRTESTNFEERRRDQSIEEVGRDFKNFCADQRKIVLAGTTPWQTVGKLDQLT
jgi:hypothetical protein